MPSRSKGTRSTNPKLVPPFTPRKSGREIRLPYYQIEEEANEEANNTSIDDLIIPPLILIYSPSLPLLCPPPPKRSDKSGQVLKEKLTPT